LGDWLNIRIEPPGLYPYHRLSDQLRGHIVRDTSTYDGTLVVVSTSGCKDESEIGEKVKPNISDVPSCLSA